MLRLTARTLRSLAKPTAFGISQRFQQTKPKLSISGDVIPSFGNVHLFPDRVALKDSTGSYTYANLFACAKELAVDIGKKVDDKQHERIMFLASNDADYVITLWAIWMSGQIAVPLSPHHPKSMLLYYANDTNSTLLITTPQYTEPMQNLSKSANIKLHVLDDQLKSQTIPTDPENKPNLESPLSLSFYSGSNALILYTSGTTGNPKGVVLSHKNLVFSINTLVDAWKWTQNDVILHTLPLHHVHGLVNALLCPLYVGAKVNMLPKFDPNLVWSSLLGINARSDDRRISVFMAVPTIYSKLIDEYERVFSEDDKMTEHIRNTLKSKMRLMVSGSAPLPEKLFRKWHELSGHQLLERYGMTETGMILSNLYEGEKEPGFVGLPLPNVAVKLVENDATTLDCTNKNHHIVVDGKDGCLKEGAFTGELYVKSDGVFKEYYGRPDATRKEFTTDGWFKTGDVCSYVTEKNKFKIIGRKSADFIKSGGYKISTFEVETVLSGHPNVKECIVLGVADKEWGEKVAAVLVASKQLDTEELKKWAGEKLPKYSVPTIWKIVEEMPKNALGKVNKKDLVKTLLSN